ncbi:FkbM family methyltransferase [Egbenema bharatensis]|uniref:FkbM family methyltransferase n=1 Tax=Egbenema bharatensis TaxID=3463334 RepID=UPI003A847342
MRFKEYMIHCCIGTPLERMAYTVRSMAQLPQRIKHPELEEIYVESARMEMVMAQVITDSMNCIDIGAHLGSVLNQMQTFSPHGVHIAIEPIPYKSHWLKQKFPSVRILQTAISDFVGKVEFFLQSQQSGFSGLRLHTNGVEQQSIERLQVPCTTLDEIVPSDRSIDFIKIDVEGGELSVLQGGETVLDRCHPSIIFECTQSGLDAHEVSPTAVYDFFQTHSYSIFLMKDWLAQGHALSCEQFLESMQYPFQAFNFLAVPKEA